MPEKSVVVDQDLSKLRVAIVHYWLIGMRGGEKVVEELCTLFPEADIYTHVVDPDKLSDRITSHNITETFIGRLPMARRLYQRYLPLMPRALESLDLRRYDLVISSESGPAKGVLTGPDTLHVCYCHSPMRYLWDMYPDYREQAGLLSRVFMTLLFHRLRIWDAVSASRVDHFIANSGFIKRRIAKTWGKPSTVINPPVDLDTFTPRAQEAEPFYLFVGELVGYKRADLAVDTFTRNGKPLVVIGEGSEKAKLEQRAGPNVTFLGRTSLDVLKDHYARCRALVFPGVEDFGIVPLEAMASGRPVIAFAKGGATETVKDGVTGMFFHQQSIEAMDEAISLLENKLLPTLNQDVLAAHVAEFSREQFRSKISEVIRELLAQHRSEVS